MQQAKRLWLVVLMLLVAGAAFALNASNPEVVSLIEKKRAGDRNERERYQTRLPSGAGTLVVNELDEVVDLYTTSFDEMTGWTIENNLNDAWTWFNSADSVDYDGFDSGFEEAVTQPFMWVDSDQAGSSGPHLIERLISPVVDATGYPYVYLTLNHYYNDWYSSPDSGYIEVSTDGGTTWEMAQVYTEDTEEYPAVVDISALAANEAAFQVRFTYDDGDGWSMYWGIDDVVIKGSDAPADFHPPTIEVLTEVGASYVGNDTEILIEATDDVALDSVMLYYALGNNGNVTSLDSALATATANPDEFSAIIPGTFAAEDDTVLYYATAVDGAGNLVRDPGSDTEWFDYVVFPASMYKPMVQLDTFTWLDITDDGTNLGLTDDGRVAIPLSEHGLGSFNWYDAEYDTIWASSNGWISFGSDPGTNFASHSLPSTSGPEGMIQLCADDLDPATAGSGNAWVGVENGMLVVSFEDVWFYGFPEPTWGPDMQVALDPATGVVYLNYQEIAGFIDEEGAAYTGSHYIGYEDSSETVGLNYYSGSDFVNPANQTSFIIGEIPGTIAGTITENDGTTPIEGATVKALSPEGAVLGTTTADAAGAYSLAVLEGEGYAVAALAATFVPDTSYGIAVVSEQTTTVDLSLEPSPPITVNGTVTSADTPGTPVEGATVTIVELGLSSVTDATGSYSIANVPEGVYSIDVSFETFAGLYHNNQHFSELSMYSADMPIDLQLLEILPPQNLTATPGELQIEFSWEEPLNHAGELVLAHGLEHRLRHLEEFAGRSLSDKERYYQQRYAAEARRLAAMLRVELDLGESELDAITDFSGYRVTVDGTVLDTLISGTSYVHYVPENGVDLTLSVAADYGYGAEYLVFTDELTSAANGILLQDLDWPYEWVEIRPDFGGSGTPLGLGDEGESDPISMGSMAITHFGTDYDHFIVGANGAISYDTTASIDYTPDDFPDDGSPNNLVAPFWSDLTDDGVEGQDVWYQVDEQNGRVVVSWNTALFGDDSGNVHSFQLVMYPTIDQYIFQYQSAPSGWMMDDGEVQTTTIGIEDSEGLVGYQLPTSILGNETAVMVGFVQPPSGTVTGVVAEMDGTPIEGASVRVDGSAWFGSATAGDGSFSIDVPVGTHDFSAIAAGHWPSELQQGMVSEEATLALDTLFLSYPQGSLSPTSTEMTWFEDVGTPVSVQFTLESNGSGPLSFVSWKNRPFATNPDSLLAWLTLGPASGNVDPGNTTTLTLTIDPTADPDFSYTLGQSEWVGVNVHGENMADTLTGMVEIFFALSTEEGSALPQQYALHPNHPNPFNPSTTLHFDLVEAQQVQLTIYNVMGQRVATLVDERMQAGRHAVLFHAGDLASGLYFCRINAGPLQSTRKLMLMR